MCREFGPPGRLSLLEEPDPTPGPGEVVVAVEAAGVSFVGGLIARGLYQVRPRLPYTPGSTVAGRVHAVGRGVDGRAVGDRAEAKPPRGPPRPRGLLRAG